MMMKFFAMMMMIYKMMKFFAMKATIPFLQVVTYSAANVYVIVMKMRNKDI